MPCRARTTCRRPPSLTSKHRRRTCRAASRAWGGGRDWRAGGDRQRCRRRRPSARREDHASAHPGGGSGRRTLMADNGLPGLARGLTNYGDRDFALYLRRSFARSMGYSTKALSRPIVGIADSASGFNNCHRHFPELIEAVKRGVLAAGGTPITFPTISLGEVFLDPTSMLYRNLMSMDVEVMGTASTMACITEALGMALPGTAAIPAVHADRLRAAEATGEAAVALAHSRVTPDRIVTDHAIENALRVLLSIGGSTNAIVHLTAIAGRLGIPISLPTVNRLSDETPVLVDLKPSGQHYMEDFFAAGGMGAVLRELKPKLHLDCLTVTGQTLGDRLNGDGAWVDRNVIRSAAEPFQPVGGLVALFGSLAPRGAILKRSAADARLFEREGRTVVFESLEDLANRVDDPALDVTADDFLVLQNAGPKGAPGMPEAGYLPIPQKLSRAGVTDMVRISDARMSGTAYGTIVLHVTPESADGGPLGLVKTGDRIKMSVKARRLDLLVDDAELRRRANGKSAPAPKRGYRRLYLDHVLQADLGCDFDFLRGGQA